MAFHGFLFLVTFYDRSLCLRTLSWSTIHLFKVCYYSFATDYLLFNLTCEYKILKDFFTRVSSVSAVFFYLLVSVSWYYTFSLELPRFTNALSMVFPEYLNETYKQFFVQYCNNMMQGKNLLLKLLRITFEDSNVFNLLLFKLYYKLIT